jgi:hypothetical protein
MHQQLGMYATLMHKTLAEKSIGIPKPEMHIFLSGFLERSFNENYQKLAAPYVAKDRKEMMTKIDINKDLTYTNWYPYLVTFHTGEHFLVIYSQLGYDIPEDFMRLCFGSASCYGKKMGYKTSSELLEALSSDVKKYVHMLNVVYQYLDENSEVLLSKEDYNNFKNYVRGLEKREKIIYINPKIRNAPDGSLLL